MKTDVRRIVLCALFAALAFVATIIPVPVPMLHGYVNIGDSAVLLCAYAAGGLFGALAAGAGCAIADITLSFALYAPATFVIKAAMAFCAYLFFKNGKMIFRAAGCVVAEIIMVLGYLVLNFSFMVQAVLHLCREILFRAEQTLSSVFALFRCRQKTNILQNTLVFTTARANFDKKISLFTKY